MFDFDYLYRSKALALLLDPDKVIIDQNWIDVIIEASPDLILIGGSQPFPFEKLANMVEILKQEVDIPLIGFPGDISQIHIKLDALLALSVVQSTNTKYVLSPLFQVSEFVVKNHLTTFFTPYLILGQTGETAVEKILNDKMNQIKDIKSLESYLYGLQIINPRIVYLEAGSGSADILDSNFVTRTKEILSSSYLFAGGGVRSIEQALTLWEAGADCVVVGNWIEDSKSALKELGTIRNEVNLKLN
jgi:putative glycerol-1-phosphate prenyltransferase